MFRRSPNVVKTKLIALCVLVASSSAYGVDASKIATIIGTIGHWQVVQFAMPQVLMFRAASTSINSPSANVWIDFPPESCTPDPIVLNMDVGHYTSLFNGGMMLFEYKVPGQENSVELVGSQMTPGDYFAFFAFKGLTAQRLSNTHDKGTLAIWIPASGDGTVKRSANMYFSMDGFTSALDRAKKLCLENH
jgi:hypothetical protein